MTTRKVLNVGGNSPEILLPPEYAGWDNLLLDIDERCQPDVLCDARELTRLPRAGFDSVYCAHNLEHYYRHDVGKVLSGFHHVLKEDGFVFIRVPDMACLMRTVVQNGLDIDDKLYDSAVGPIAVHDAIYGYGAEIERSESDFFAHKAGYSQKALVSLLEEAGFPVVFSHCANFEVIAYAFKCAPTAYAATLLRLADFAEDRLRLGERQSADGAQTDPIQSVPANAEEPVAPHSRFASPRRLHIGGKTSADGWEVMNVTPAFYVDHIGNANDLSRFADDTFIEIYASHIAEHLDYKDELMATLVEWHRVLEPGGRLMVSVPDLNTLAWLVIAQSELTVEDRFNAMRMLFGGHMDQHDYHLVGLNQEFLSRFLSDAGYVNLRRIENFNVFNDTSSKEFGGVAISLNMIAEKPRRTDSAFHKGNAEAAATRYDDGSSENRGKQGRRADEAIIVRMSDGIAMSVPATLKCPTSYVLLEQEQWFEREVGFIVRSLGAGMNAIDIGADLGPYCLPLARAIGTGGRVIAFEPKSGQRRHLAASRLANGLDGLTISGYALAEEQEGSRLADARFGGIIPPPAPAAGEASLERAGVSTLDLQKLEFRWPAMAFVRIGVAGQAGRIIAGGRDFFASESPLVMYKINDGSGSDSSARWIFEALGYRTFRLLGDASCLVPVRIGDRLDSFELNLFAAKPDRAVSLAGKGLLVDQETEHGLSQSERSVALQDVLSRPYARAFDFSLDDIAHCPFGEALIAYAAFKAAGLPPARRHAALKAAFAMLNDYCRSIETLAGLATLARVALDLGHREYAVDVLARLVKTSGVEIDQPFFSPCERYEVLSPEGRESEWFAAAANEQYELARSHSSFFRSGDLDPLIRLSESPFSSAAISRRLILEAARRGHGLPYLLGIVDHRHSHENPAYWTAAGLPNILEMI